MATSRWRLVNACAAAWSAMRPAANGRACDACQRVVVDLVDRTPEEAEAILAAQSGPVCGRVRVDRRRQVVFLAAAATGLTAAAAVMLPAGDMAADGGAAAPSRPARAAASRVPPAPLMAPVWAGHTGAPDPRDTGEPSDTGGPADDTDVDEAEVAGGPLPALGDGMELDDAPWTDDTGAPFDTGAPEDDTDLDDVDDDDADEDDPDPEDERTLLTTLLGYVEEMGDPPPDDAHE